LIVAHQHALALPQGGGGDHSCRLRNPQRFPVRIGLDRQPSRRGNMTGVTQLNLEIGPKLLELMHRVAPRQRTLRAGQPEYNPNATACRKTCRQRRRRSGVNLHVLNGGRNATSTPPLLQPCKCGPADSVLGGNPVINILSAPYRRTGAASQAAHDLSVARVRRGGGLMTTAATAIETHFQAGLYAGGF